MSASVNVALRAALCVLAGVSATAVAASDPATAALEQTLVNRNTTLNLIEKLVERGILDRESADTMIREAREQAVQEARGELAKLQPAPAGDDGKGGSMVRDDAVHVFYIPQAVKEELRRDVEANLERRVVAEVKTQAKAEQWGAPAALPDWVKRFTLSGDFRLRAEALLFGEDNQPFSYLDFPTVNARGGVNAAGLDAFENTTVDRHRLRARLRLGLDSAITDGLVAGVRLSTSNERSPVALNQDLGQYGQQYEVVIDRLYARYDWRDVDGYEWITLWAGRHENPWLSTEALFDRDLSFEGLAGTLRIPLADSDDESLTAGAALTNWGFSRAGGLFLTVGGFPLEEVEFSTQDKWLLGGQAGVDWGFGGASRLKLGVGYYDFIHVNGRQNALGSRTLDFTAPQFFTRGNSLMRISNDVGETLANPRLVGLAADFDVVDVTAAWDFARFDPLHVVLTGSYSTNVGFDRSDIFERTGQDIEKRANAYEVRVDVGQQQIHRRHDWNAGFGYRRVERDAVLDAYTNSLFHFGGTDAKGWMLNASYGVAKNTWFTARWLSTEAIDGPPLGIDTLLLDFNTGL